VDSDGLHVEKGYFNFKTLWKDMKELDGYPAMLHCRLATHGSRIEKNCHPFLLDNGVALAHNGIIHINLLERDMTDSESFAKVFVEPFSWDALRTDAMTQLLESYIGVANKVAMLGEDGTFWILNAADGVAFQGLWFSNDSYARSYMDYYKAIDKPYIKNTVSVGERCFDCYYGPEEVLTLEECGKCMKDRGLATPGNICEDCPVDPNHLTELTCEACFKKASEARCFDCHTDPYDMTADTCKTCAQVKTVDDNFEWTPVGAFCAASKRLCNGIGKAPDKCPECENVNL
jgi:hypothetical protein